MVTSDMANRIDLEAFGTGKAYSIAEAARLARTSPQNVRRWLYGYRAPGHQMQPVFGEKKRDRAAPAVSFLELIEIAVASDFRRQKEAEQTVSLKRVRDAHKYLRRHFGLKYPFASLKLRQEGGHILHDFDEAEPGKGTLVVSMGGQWVLPKPVEEELARIEYKDGLAAIWYPFGPLVPIAVNPLIAAGSPTVKGTGVRVETIRERVAAGDKIGYLSADYGIPQSDIEQVLQYAV